MTYLGSGYVAETMNCRGLEELPQDLHGGTLQEVHDEGLQEISQEFQGARRPWREWGLRKVERLGRDHDAIGSNTGCPQK